jgi:surfeit locus 1 family protein
LSGASSPLKLAAIALAALAGFAALASLGVWQLQRLAWKRDLIQRIDERIHAPAVTAPGPAQWPLVNAASSEYLRVRVQGRYLDDRDTLVQAVTQRGPGFWVMTPLATTDGYTVLINRGFVPPTYRSTHSRSPGDSAGDSQGELNAATIVTGLLRISEPQGGFLRDNEPAADRWYSRDVAAIAAARGLTNVAPYFIDADAGPEPGAPAGGMTVIAFPNNHLQYALTWFALALMVVGGAGLVFRHEWRLRRLTAP